MQTENLPIILEFSGSHKEIGLSYGEACRENIREFATTLRENLFSRSRVKVEEKTLNDLLRKYWAYSVEYAPELSEEVKAIAQGADVSLEDVILLNSFLDIINTRDDRMAAVLFGCTSFGACPEATTDNLCLIGQNYEMENFYKKFMVLLKIQPPSAPPSLIYTYAGVIGCAGLNAEGLGLCINFLHPNDANYGVIYPFLVRKILSQLRIGDGIGAATIGYKAGGTNLLIGHKTGHIFSIETSSRDHDILFPINGVIAHSNHYISDKMKKYDLVIWDQTYDSAITRRGSTILRWYVADKTLKDKVGRIDIDLLKTLSRNTINYPYSICCFGNPDDDDLHRGETNASMIFDLTNIKAFIAFGNPAQSKFLEFDV